MAQFRTKRRQGLYFAHHVDMRHNPSIQAMRIEYGAEGYGWYWILVEMMREEQDGNRLQLDAKNFFDVVAKELGCRKKVAEKFISDCISEFRLFELDGNCLWNKRLLENMQLMEEISEIKRAAAIARWKNREPVSAEAPSGDAYAMQRKEKKEKENKTKETELDSQDDCVESEDERIAAYWEGRDLFDPDYRQSHGIVDPPSDEPPRHIIAEGGVEPMEDREPATDEFMCGPLCFVKDSYKQKLMKTYAISSDEEFGKLVNTIDVEQELWFLAAPNVVLEAFLEKEMETKNKTKEKVEEKVS